MLILEKKVRRDSARRVYSLVRHGARRKEAMLLVSTSLRQHDFKCTTRTIYRWLKEFKITLPR